MYISHTLIYISHTHIYFNRIYFQTEVNIIITFLSNFINNRHALFD